VLPGSSAELDAIARSSPIVCRHTISLPVALTCGKLSSVTKIYHEVLPSS
jgi:hypothetical protein